MLKDMPSVRNADEVPVKLAIEIEGKGSIEGGTEKSLTKDGEVTWIVTKEKASDSVPSR
jgi:hypothetical protein